MPSGEVCNRYSLAQARFLPPHWRVTRLTVDIAPRSIEIHCGMRGFVAPCQRVPASPSTAAPATVAGPVSLDAVAGLPCDIGGGAPVGAGAAEAGVAERLAVRVAARLATPTATDLRIILCTRCATVASPVVGLCTVGVAGKRICAYFRATGSCRRQWRLRVAFRLEEGAVG